MLKGYLSSGVTGLTISKCPELSLETPIQLSNLEEFNVLGSPKVGVLFDDAELFTSQLQGMKQIVALSITNCNSLTSLPLSILPSTLKRIRISSGKLKLETPVRNIFLEVLDINGCESIDDISPEFVPRARNFSVKSCHNLTRLFIPAGADSLNIWYCENLERLLVACGTQMTLLRRLFIKNCKKLKWLPEHMQELLPSLKELKLENCPGIESFLEGGLPFNLEVLHIWDCEKLVNGRKKWRIQRLPYLRPLVIVHDGSDAEILAGENWELPCSIRSLSIRNLKTLSSQVLKSLTSLEYLSTNNVPQIQSLLEEGLPSSLSELKLIGHNGLHSLPIEGIRRLTSLQRLYINNCRNLQSIPESTLPSSLSVLTISHCPNLQSLPVKGRPSSISELSIYRCPLLKQLLEFDKGDYWTKIAHVPTIKINGEYL